MKDYFSFLPEEENSIILLDTCAFNRCFSWEMDKEESMSFIEYLNSVSKRISALTKKLEGMENWMTIKEVVKEFRNGIAGLQEIRASARNKEVIAALERTLHQRTRVYKFINKAKRDAIESAPKDLTKKIECFWLPKVEEIFLKVGGKTNEENTDCKLIATTLGYAESSPVYMFSCDSTLLDTYSICAMGEKPPRKRTYVLDENRKKATPTEEYYFNRHLNRLSIKIIPNQPAFVS